MKRKEIARLFIASAVLGVLVGLASYLFVRAIQLGSRLLWHGLFNNGQSNPWVVIGLSLAGGLVMGLCVKHFGKNDDGIGFESVMSAIKKDGALGVKQLKRVVLNTYPGLITGASIGPESPLVTLGGFCGDWLARRFGATKQQLMAFIAIALGGSLGTLVDSPVAGPIMFAEQPPTPDPNANRLLVFTSMVAASIGFGIYLLLGAPLLEGTKLVPAYSGLKLSHLLYGLIIGLVGMGIGLALRALILRLRTLSTQLIHGPVVRGAAAGLTIGLIAAVSPLLMFDGSAQLSELVKNAAHYGWAMLLVLAALRLLSTSVALGAGYQGGNIFPTIFIAGATGLAINLLFPFIPAPVAMVSCMAAAMYVFNPLPLFVIFLFTEISSFSLIPVMAMALVGAYLINALTAKSSPQDHSLGST